MPNNPDSAIDFIKVMNIMGMGWCVNQNELVNALVAYAELKIIEVRNPVRVYDQEERRGKAWLSEDRVIKSNMDLAFAVDMMDEVVKRNCLTVGVEAWQTVKTAVLAQQTDNQQTNGGRSANLR